MIKGVDRFSKMIDNVRHYLMVPFLVLNPKYLFVPVINDNETDILEFVKLCLAFGVDFVTPVFSFFDGKYFDSDRAKEMFGLLVRELADTNIFSANVDTLYSERYRKLDLASFGTAD
jgi:hypothetical protein